MTQYQNDTNNPAEYTPNRAQNRGANTTSWIFKFANPRCCIENGEKCIGLDLKSFELKILPKKGRGEGSRRRVLVA